MLGATAQAGVSVAACSAASNAAAPEVGQRSLRSVGLCMTPFARDLREDPAATLTAVSAVGFRQIELAGGDVLALNHSEIRRIMDGEGIIAPSLQVGLDDVILRPARVLSAARDLGANHVVLPPAPRRLRTPDGWNRLADLYNGFGLRASLSGQDCLFRHGAAEFGPANHRAPAESAMTFMLSATDPTMVGVELDLYWTAHARQDMTALFAAHPGRFRLAHASDMAANGARIAVGQGLIDYGAIFSRNHVSGLESVFIAPVDAGSLEAAAQSLLTLADLRF